MANKKITDLQLRSNVEDDVNYPGDDGVQTYRTTALQMWEYIYDKLLLGSFDISNLTIATSVGSSALTIALKTRANANPSSTDKLQIGFRDATASSGRFYIREIASSISLVISSGSTLGQVSTKASAIWVYLIDNAGSPELAVSTKLFRENQLVSTTAEGGAGAADSAILMYSASARSNVPCRLIGKIINTQTTAGTWASAGTKIEVGSWSQLVGNQEPTRQVFTSSSDWYRPAGCTRIRVHVQAAGGGGGGSGGAAGSNGNSSSFGGSVLVAGAGTAGSNNGGGGGNYSSASPAEVIFAVNGGNGGGSTQNNGFYGLGGMGGCSWLGGNGANGASSGGGGSASTNSGSGGGGSSDNQTNGQFSGGGGGAGGHICGLIKDMANTYAVVVGAGGAGASNAGSGGAGVVWVEEFYD